MGVRNCGNCKFWMPEVQQAPGQGRCIRNPPQLLLIGVGGDNPAAPQVAVQSMFPPTTRQMVCGCHEVEISGLENGSGG